MHIKYIYDFYDSIDIFLGFGGMNVQVHYDMTRCLMGATHHYLTLAEFGRCPKLSHRNE